MKTKFIGIDGFGEIESVKTSRKPKSRKGGGLKKLCKVSRAVIAESARERREKKANKPTRLEQHYANLRNQGSQKLTTTAIARSAKARKSAEIKRSNIKRPISPNFLKHKAVLGAATFAVVVALSVSASNNLFSFNAFASDSKAVSEESTVSVKVNDTQLAKVVHSDMSRSMAEDEILTDGYGLYIDNNLSGVSLDKEGLEKGLQKLLDDYKAKYDDTTTDKFANNVEIVYGSYKSKDIEDCEDIIKKNLDNFSYSLTTDIEYTQSIPYETVIQYDEDEYDDFESTVQKGKQGREKVVYRVTFTDGIQTDSELSSITTLKEPRDKIVVVGTKERPVEKAASYSYSSSSTGSFMWPVPHTTNITSYYEPRWGSFHTGIDIAGGGDYGQPIVASDSGTVEWAGYDNSGYGNYVIINHHNGYKTLYGHCSALYVSSGQSVSQGESIGAIGSTGFSTGPHLHFEVRTDSGERLNPLNYL